MNPIDLPPELLALQAIEDSFVAAIQGSPIGPFLAQVDTLPGDMSPQEIGNRLKKVPGAFVSFSGGPGRPTGTPGIEGRFTIFVVVGQGPTEQQRRRGSVVSVGAYTLLQAVITYLHGKSLPPPSIAGTPIDSLVIGTPLLVDASRYWSEEVDKVGLAIYGAVFSLQIEFPPAPDADALEDLLTVIAQIALDGQADADLAGGDSLPLPSGDISSEDDISLAPSDGSPPDGFTFEADILS